MISIDYYEEIEGFLEAVRAQHPASSLADFTVDGSSVPVTYEEFKKRIQTGYSEGHPPLFRFVRLSPVTAPGSDEEKKLKIKIVTPGGSSDAAKPKAKAVILKCRSGDTFRTALQSHIDASKTFLSLRINGHQVDLDDPVDDISRFADPREGTTGSMPEFTLSYAESPPSCQSSPPPVQSHQQILPQVPPGGSAIAAISSIVLTAADSRRDSPAPRETSPQYHQDDPLHPVQAVGYPPGFGLGDPPIEKVWPVKFCMFVGSTKVPRPPRKVFKYLSNDTFRSLVQEFIDGSKAFVSLTIDNREVNLDNSVDEFAGSPAPIGGVLPEVVLKLGNSS
jgi:hypothetical protein